MYDRKDKESEKRTNDLTRNTPLDIVYLHWALFEHEIKNKLQTTKGSPRTANANKQCAHGSASSARQG